MSVFLLCPVDGCSHQIPDAGDGRVTDLMVDHVMNIHRVPELSAAWHTTHAQTIARVAA
ncbi:hypothetical protein [Streptomyces sp. NBC_01794]|uniref:hypothetical protein n=1 Tax=Streptomyces sp. NBC_01794 TaxID=2975942 RepID=UPI003093AE0B|nr:hypothetical protein OIE54_12245 [Streptomyces sp. NBC_01794]